MRQSRPEQPGFQYLILEGAEVGETSKIGHNCIIFNGGKVGEGCNIQCNTNIYHGVTLEDDVFIGPCAVFTNDLTPRAFDPKPPEEMVPTLVKKGASIGANATILCGITIGEYALIGAGAVITKDVPPREVWCGNPARFIRKVRKSEMGGRK